MQRKLEGILRGTWNDTSTDSPYQKIQPRRWADDVFRIAVLNCWPRYFVPKEAQANRIIALYKEFDPCDEPETMAEKEVRDRVMFFIHSKMKFSKTAKREREKKNLETVKNVVEMHRQVCTAAREGHLLLRPDGYGGFGFFRPPAGAARVGEKPNSGVMIAGIQGLLGQVASISRDIAEGHHGAKSSIVCCHCANGKTVYRPLTGPESYFNGACVHCAQARPMNRDGSGDGWEAVQWTRPEIRDESGQQVFIWYGPTYDGGSNTLQAVSPYLPEFVVMPVGTEEDMHSTGRCPRCIEYASSGFKDLRDRWGSYVATELLDWHRWLAGKSKLAKAVVELTSSGKMAPARAKRIASKFGIRSEDVEGITGGSIALKLLSKAQEARPKRDIAKQLIYGPRRLNLAAKCEAVNDPRYFITRLTPEELEVLEAAAATVSSPHASSLDKVLVLRRLYPFFDILE